jgi:DNA topoisomerase-1
MVLKYSKKDGNYVQCSNSECGYKEVIKKEEKNDKENN